MTGIGTFIVVCYTVLLLAVVALCYFLLRRWWWKWMAITPMLLGVAWLAYAPFAEESNIETRFAELCKDAGVKIVRKVEVEGFYNDVESTGLGPRHPQAVAEYEKQGFRYYEKRLARYVDGRVVENPEASVVHIEKVDGEWKTTLLTKPRARYYFKQTRNSENVGHKIWISEWALVDSLTGEAIGRDVLIKSLPNRIDLWWAAMLGDPTRYCPGFGYEQKRGSLLRDALIPLKQESKS